MTLCLIMRKNKKAEEIMIKMCYYEYVYITTVEIGIIIKKVIHI